MKKSKYKSQKNDLILPVVASSMVASRGIVNGRNIPVIFVESDKEKKIDEIISIHQTMHSGNIQFNWGATPDNKFVVLIVNFESPIIQKLVILFDIIKFGIVVEQILYSQCVWLMIGDENSKLSSCINYNRILLEVPSDEFKEIWKPMFRNVYSKHLKKEYGFSDKDAYNCFDKMLEELSILKQLRM